MIGKQYGELVRHPMTMGCRIKNADGGGCRTLVRLRRIQGQRVSAFYGPEGAGYSPARSKLSEIMVSRKVGRRKERSPRCPDVGELSSSNSREGLRRRYESLVLELGPWRR